MVEEKKFVEQKPILESWYSKSKDGKYLIHRVTITTIKPVKYIEKVLQGSNELEGLEELEEEIKG